MNHAVKIAAVMAAGLMLGSAAMAPAFAADKPALAFVANGASDFWKAAEAGRVTRTHRMKASGY